MKKITFSIILLFHVSILFSQSTDWVLQAGGPFSDKGTSIGADTLGNIYICGFFNNGATFGTISKGNSSVYAGVHHDKQIFLAKMDSTGTFEWVVWATASYDDRGLGLYVSPDGYSYITGTCWGDLTVRVPGPNTYVSTPSGHDQSIMIKIAPDASCSWAKVFGSTSGSWSACPPGTWPNDDHSYDVEVDKNGFIYLTGFFSGDYMDFGSTTLTNPTWGSTCTPLGYVAKMDTNGDFIWAHKFDGIKDHRGSRENRLAIDNFSNVYVVGGFENTGNYGPLTLTSNGEWDPFIFKMDKDGNWIWARNVGSNKTDRADGIAIDYCDNIYITGEYRNPMVFTGANASNGTDTLSHAKKRDVFVAKITTNGDWVWAKRARSKGVDKPYQMSVDDDMQVFIGGSAGDSLKFNNSITLSNGDTTTNAFVAQLDGSGIGDWVWAKMGGGPMSGFRTGDVCEDGNNKVYAIGFFQGTASFDGYNFTSGIDDSGDYKKDVFVWKINKSNSVNVTPSNCVYIDVYPPGSGTINLTGTGTILTNSVNVSLFPCLQSLADSATLNFDAIPNTGYEFLYWDWNINTPLPTDSTENSTVFMYSSDTLIVYFQEIITDSITYIVQPPGAGTITVDGTNIISFPTTSYYNQNSNSNLTANANSGFFFSNWDFDNNTANPSSTSSNITVTWLSNDTCIVNFSVVPIDTITYIVQPPGAGTITVDGTNIISFPTTSYYNQNSNSNLTANANSGFFFSNWDFDNNTANPSSTSSNITVTWLSNDTCIINFNTTQDHSITFLTEPVGAGNIDVNAINYSTFPSTVTYPAGTNVDLVANNNTNFMFSNWTTQTNVLIPNSLDDMVNFNVVANDTIIAHYNEIDTLWVISNPISVATLEVENDIITSSPFMGLYQKGSLINIKAIPNGSNVFNQWNLNNNSLPDYNAITMFTFINDDTLFAYFNNVLALENLGDDISDIKIYPNIVENKLSIEINSLEQAEVVIELLNISGQKINDLYIGKINNKFIETFEINTTKGVYFIRISSEKTNASFKIVKL